MGHISVGIRLLVLGAECLGDEAAELPHGAHDQGPAETDLLVVVGLAHVDYGVEPEDDAKEDGGLEDGTVMPFCICG